MARDKRWITSVTQEAAKVEIKMPWTRGARRAAFIAKRSASKSMRAANA
ncbi:hypothetical protein P1J78_12425 [Psychromarinibacter sp. C21-152]|uniref:Uncharacterized protein n=1 Tax=Psychromarinibacter sediminicola TaxID=3033385 RepID=A0AAE3NT15_9RHOB|nr:hypothetical protein [Psychromarinibacter sediminicola]MDF0601542.1 hypothetical protein [Psychromarinibacter sediminicola]